MAQIIWQEGAFLTKT